MHAPCCVDPLTACKALCCLHPTTARACLGDRHHTCRHRSSHQTSLQDSTRQKHNQTEQQSALAMRLLLLWPELFSTCCPKPGTFSCAANFKPCSASGLSTRAGAGCQHRCMFLLTSSQPQGNVGVSSWLILLQSAQPQPPAAYRHHASRAHLEDMPIALCTATPLQGVASFCRGCCHPPPLLLVAAGAQCSQQKAAERQCLRQAAAAQPAAWPAGTAAVVHGCRTMHGSGARGAVHVVLCSS
jgi:hypothetical protein